MYIKPSDNMEKVHSDIRGPIFEAALRMEKNGEKVLKLNTGNPAAFGFTMPQSVKNTLIENVDKALGYCGVKGMVSAREAILNYHKSRGFENIDIEDIFICNGVSEAVSMALSALLSKGDEVLVPTPCYSLWSNAVCLTGGNPVYYYCDEQEDWNPDVEDIKKKITPKTKAIVVINPNNPTGAVYSKETVTQIAKIAEENNLVLFSDEIYDRLVFDGAEYTSAATVSNGVVVTFNGLSKSHCLCGFRCGWMVVSGDRKATEDYARALNSIAAMRLCSNALMQLCVAPALEDDAYTKEMISYNARLREQQRAVFSALDKTDLVSYVENKAAFYLFPRIDSSKINITNDKNFARKLLEEEKILIVAGSGFNCTDNYHFRIVMLPEPNAIGEAMGRMVNFLERHRGLTL